MYVHIASRKDIGDLSPSAYTDREILDTLAKRPLTPEDVSILFDTESRARLQKLLDRGQIRLLENHGVKFFIPA